MGVITISRQLGAGETSVAPALAERLGWRLVDQSVMDRECEITGVSIPQALRWDERDPSLIDKIHGLGSEYLSFLKSSRQVMHELAAKGNVIIIGRGGNFLLRANPDTLHVRLIADLPYRVKRVMEVRWTAEHLASNLIAKNDRNAALFYKHVFHADPNDSLLYDVVLRTDILGVDKAVKMIAGYFE
jgi:cytidylate kinase